MPPAPALWYILLMDFTLTTPALLFPGISLLLLAYTNRFITLAGLVRQLHQQYQQNPRTHVAGQIRNLRIRLKIIVWMQAMGVTSFFLCVVTMLLLFMGRVLAGEVLFIAALAAMLASLGLSLWEVNISIGALKLQLADMDKADMARPGRNRPGRDTSDRNTSGRGEPGRTDP
ncbi:hypothetical protein AU468_00920 [Alkalispirochaeta sphaeroplastigenens]|uniref:II family cellulose-binding protein n=2 Tax=Alkalispirochaeta sphaeroplastigenens TaxID=1187066 RepID=A0A2S4K125_9SPIO|nr:hypothetical protein AU468_00920 [Alkalispirochaeta sphaeroplastigenens]